MHDLDRSVCNLFLQLKKTSFEHVDYFEQNNLNISHKIQTQINAKTLKKQKLKI